MIKKLEKNILEKLNNDESFREEVASCLAVVFYDLQSKCCAAGLGTLVALPKLAEDFYCCCAKKEDTCTKE